MSQNYLIVNQDVLPDVFSKVIEAKKLLNSGDFKNVSEVVNEVGLSRSAFYKYKDHVFVADKTAQIRKTLISFNLTDKKGLLSSVLNRLSELGGNVLTINQNIPIQDTATVVMGIDIKELSVSVNELLVELEKLTGVNHLQLLSIE
ncbi:hypothetical protein BW731_00510 [Vagococcus martis]|uniref:UPF0735 ACT domain-containing protein BW731_00510 n=1 Tax=Vagococcus martis TaxID=1768210 RepID=A0A1V4DE72_9ENTE|nr:ACT domain-containing protein [Vagococcus martis]OPF86785.1 hypothetical protein BW731_00510 [Vagococcus martis]